MFKLNEQNIPNDQEDQLAYLEALQKAMYRLMTSERTGINELINKSMAGSLRDKTDPEHIYLDGFLHGMTLAVALINKGDLNITTLEIER